MYRFFASYRDAFGPHVEIEEQLDAGDRVVTVTAATSGVSTPV